MVARFLRAPLLHFLIGGGVLFRLVYGPAPFSASAQAEGAAPIVVSAEEVARLRAQYRRDTGLEPSAADERALIDDVVEEELLWREARARGLDQDRSVRAWLAEQMETLAEAPGADAEERYRQAVALGLDRTDLVVRRILVQKMRLLAARLNEAPPSEEELRAFHLRHRDDYVAPPRSTFWHVFLAHSRGDLAAEAQARLEQLRRTGAAPAEAVRAGDSFPVPARLVGQSAAQVAKLFGPEFAAGLPAAAPGAWSGPLTSAYGLHLVWVEAHEPGAPAPFESVRQRVFERWRDQERKRRLSALLDELRARQPLRIESAAWNSRSAS